MDKDLQQGESPNTSFFATGGTTFEVVEHFSDEQTYLDIVKAAIHREYDEV